MKLIQNVVNQFELVLIHQYIINLDKITTGSIYDIIIILVMTCKNIFIPVNSIAFKVPTTNDG